MEHHVAGLATLTGKSRGESFAAAVRDDHETAPLTKRERALVAYAIQLNDAPASLVQTDLEPLRAAGVTDPEILHANLVVGYFAFANRLTLGLGVELEDHEWGQ
ncbi:MAG: hypothetical protein AAGG01_21185 [Planctomycetota bacterium]